MATGGYARFEDDLGTREFTTADDAIPFRSTKINQQ